MRTVRQLLEGKKPGVVTIDASEPVRTAIQLMADHYIGALPRHKGELAKRNRRRQQSAISADLIERGSG